MREIALFVEDFAHQQVIGALILRVAGESSVRIRLRWHIAVGGYGRVIEKFRRFMRDLRRQGGPRPDLVVVATDANCSGMNERTREITVQEDFVPIVFAIPDPHIERWLLLDGAAFKAVFGTGCNAPDLKCERNHYKRQLMDAIQFTGTTPRLGGIEYAEDIVQHMDLDRIARQDRSFDRFVSDLRSTFGGWQT